MCVFVRARDFAVERDVGDEQQVVMSLFGVLSLSLFLYGV